MGVIIFNYQWLFVFQYIALAGNRSLFSCREIKTNLGRHFNHSTHLNEVNAKLKKNIDKIRNSSSTSNQIASVKFEVNTAMSVS